MQTIGRQAGTRAGGSVREQLAGAVALHDRRVPGSLQYIDHIAIGPAGVYVIVVSDHPGRIERRNVGGWMRPDDRLCIGGRDRTKLLAGVRGHCDDVRIALADLAGTPVHPVLCFSECEWPTVLPRPIRLGTVTCTWPRGLAKLVSTRGPLSAGDIALRAARLADALHPA